jgi:4'-phosphopantetheinyl transferase
VVVGADTALHVSVARSDGIVVAAVSKAGPIGVDVERTDDTSFPGFGSVALHSGERDGSPADRATLWTRKEAVLKAVGLGVGWGPERVLVGPAEAALGRVEGLPVVRPVWWCALDISPRYAGAVAVVGDDPPVVRVRRASPEA